ncbi:MAG: hypothetical protein WC637_02750 [Victivallales bacterium]
MLKNYKKAGSHPVIVSGHHGNDKARYLEICEKLGVVPKFKNLTLGDGTVVIDHPNYMKLVRDVASSAPQQVVDATKINFGEANKFLHQWIDAGGDKTTVRPTLVEGIRQLLETKDGIRIPEATAMQSADLNWKKIGTGDYRLGDYLVSRIHAEDNRYGKGDVSTISKGKESFDAVPKLWQAKQYAEQLYKDEQRKESLPNLGAKDQLRLEESVKGGIVRATANNKGEPVDGNQEVYQRLSPEDLARSGGDNFKTAEDVASRGIRGLSQSSADKISSLKPSENSSEEVKQKLFESSRNALWKWAVESKLTFPFIPFKKQWIEQDMMGGGENRNILGAKGDTLWKINDLGYHNSNPLEYLNRIAVHNYLFGDSAPLTFRGLIKDDNGKICVVCIQPYIKYIRGANQEEVESDLKNIGFIKKVDKSTDEIYYVNPDIGVKLEDLHPYMENNVFVVQENPKRLAYVDPMISITDASKLKNMTTDEIARHSVDVTPEQDLYYIKAVESADMETAQKMVDEEAKKQGYTVKGYLWCETENGFPLCRVISVYVCMSICYFIFSVSHELIRLGVELPQHAHPHGVSDPPACVLPEVPL